MQFSRIQVIFPFSIWVAELKQCEKYKLVFGAMDPAGSRFFKFFFSAAPPFAFFFLQQGRTPRTPRWRRSFERTAQAGPGPDFFLTDFPNGLRSVEDGSQENVWPTMCQGSK